MARARTCAKCDAELNAESALDVCSRCVAAQVLAPDESYPSGPTEQPGDRIGRYKLREKIGEGGCGVVYVAEQEEPVRRRVALKVIKLGMDTRDVIARFEAERQALAMMDHPNIAKVLDAGTTDTGRPFFVMELVRGIRITDYCDENKLNTERRLDLFIQVCRAVQHAHQKGVIHRDIKPSNILVTINDGVPVPKVIDFGIAKATEGRLTDKTVYTQLHQFIGTPAYMSPEQALMTSLDIDTRSDIYSLGVLLYELLTGRPPFDPRTMLAAGLDELRRTIREQEPPRPSTRLSALPQDDLTTAAKRRSTEPPKLIHSISGDLDWIVMKCLEKDRTRRYETANGLAADIQRHLGNEAVLARPPSAVYRLQKTWRRNKLAVSAGAVIALVLVIATGISSWQAIRACRAETLAARRLGESEQAREEAESISKFLSEVFRSSRPGKGDRTITVAASLDAAAERLEKDASISPARRGKLQTTIGHTYDALGLYRQAIGLHEKVLAYRRTVLGPEHLDTISAMVDLANSYGSAGRKEEALKLREQVLTQRRKVLGPDHSDTLGAMHNLALSYADAGRREETLKLQEEVLQLSRKAKGSEDPGAMHNLALSYSSTGRKEEALKLQEEVLALWRKAHGPEHPDTLMAMHNLATSYFDAGRKDEALKLREEALPLHRKVLGPEHPYTLDAIENLAIAYSDVGRHKEALRLWEDTVTVRQKLFGPDHPKVAATLNNLGWALVKLHRWPEAEKTLQSALDTLDRSSSARPKDWSLPLVNMTVVFSRQEKFAELESFLNKRLQTATNPSIAALYLETRGRFRARRCRWPEAAADYARAIELQPENHEHYHHLAALLAQSGDLEAYRKHCQREITQFRETKDSHVAERMAKDCLILPNSGADLRVVAAWAELAVTAGQKSDDLPWFQNAKGLAEYRQGNFAEAIEWAQKTLSRSGDKYRDPQATAVLAMAQQQSGQRDAARASLAKAVEMDGKLRKLESGDLGDNWLDWIIVKTLLGEARNLIEGDTRSRKPTEKITSTTQEANP